MRSKIVMPILVLAVCMSVLVCVAHAWGVPPDISAAYSGLIRVRAKRGETTADHTVYVRKCAGGYAGACGAWLNLGTLTSGVTEFDTSLQVLSGDYVDVKIDSNVLPDNWNPIVYSTDRVRNPRWPENPPGARVVAPHGSSGELCGDSPEMSIADVLASSHFLLSSSCWEDWEDYDWNDLAFVVDYVPGSVRTVGAHVRNPQGTPVARPVGIAQLDWMWAFWINNSRSLGIVSDARDGFLPPAAWAMSQGSYVDLNPNDVLAGVTPSAPGGWSSGYDLWPRSAWMWEESSWPAGQGRDATFILATMTPTPTPIPAPRLAGVHVRNPQGTPVAAPVGIAKIDGLGPSWSYRILDSMSLGTVSDAVGPLFPVEGWYYQGLYIDLTNNVLIGVTPSAPGGWSSFYDLWPKSAWMWDEWSWPAGEQRDVTFVLAAATPTPTNTPTRTPSPTPTNTPTPTPSPTPTNTPSPTPTNTPTRTPSPTPTNTPVSFSGSIPGGSVFVHVWEPGMAEKDQGDFRTDELIYLELQRWSGLAPIFNPNPAQPPQICQGMFCYPGAITTTSFTLSGIYTATGVTPVETFTYPNGQAINYTRRYQLGDVNYATCDHLWLLSLSEGGAVPPTPNAPTGCRQALALRGYPGTYRIEGVLHAVTDWTLPFPYRHEMDYPIAFYVVQLAPMPQQP